MGPQRAGTRQRSYFWIRRGLDLLLCVVFSPLVLPVLLFLVVFLLILNPFLNPGPLLFWQERMGRDGRPFRICKFRTMRPEGQGTRGAFDPLEDHRITFLGDKLRKSHLDELPQLANVVLGHMSLIGPRPDALEHAREYLATIPGYRERLSVLPGITGYAQTELGYIDNAADVRTKVAYDLHYVRNAGLWMDLRIAFRTVPAMLGGKGRGA